MAYIDVDFNGDIATILEGLEANATKAHMMRDEIKKLKVDIAPEQKEELDSKNYQLRETTEEQIEEDEIFEDEVKSYIKEYERLKSDFTEDELMEILPSPTDYRYIDIIRRLQAESVKNIIVYKDIFQETIDKEELLIIKESIELEKNKKLSLTKILESEKEEKIEQKKNKIVLVPTTTGNIRVLEELKAVPIEFREPFKKLIDSIIDGTFKNKKNFINNRKLAGFTEVKGFQVRVVYVRIDLDTFGLITAFIKKTDNSKLYRDSLELKFSDYKEIKEMFKKQCKTEEFQKENEKNLEELYRILTGEKTTSKKKIKGDNND